MSKLFLLISLIGFFSITASADGPPKKTNNNTPVKFGYDNKTYGFGVKTPNVTIPCKAGTGNCLDQKKPAAFQKKSLDGLKGEDRVKVDCYNKSGGYGDKYQDCLSDNGVFHVNRNINSDDSSQSDSRLCMRGNPVCDGCLAKTKGITDRVERRKQVATCVEVASAPKPAPKPKTVSTPKPKKEEPVATNDGCSKKSPHKCTTQESCVAEANGVWDGRACAVAPCPLYSTADNQTGSGNTCKCDANPDVILERGTDQVCPSACGSENHQAYDNTAHKCICMEGYQERGLTCVSKVASQGFDFGECIKELQDKVKSCDDSAVAAVNKCDATSKENGSDDTIGTMQSLLQNAAGMVGGGASDNCAGAAIAGSTGYYALEELRGKCDTEIGSCKTSCTDSAAYINSNKDRVYQACRAQQWNYYYGMGCRFDAPYQQELGIVPTEAAFNTHWDADHKPEFDQKIQDMLGLVTADNSQCESGTAVSKRDQMSGYMDDANNAVRSANQCQCQLSAGSGSTDCSKAPGPADCAANPSLTGCAQATVNCNSATDTSPKCACFRNPNSNECKSGIAATAKTTAGGSISGFAGASASGKQSAITGFGGGGETSSGGSGTDVSGDLSGLNSNENSAGGASGTTAADGGSPFAAAGGAGGSGGGGGVGGGADGAAGKVEGEGSEQKGFRGLFETAKNALGGLFKDKKNDKSTYTGADGITRDANGNPISSANKWRPRGMVRGLAGNDTEIAGKFEDIWKVMNKQYKVQDQKDSFIFGEKN